MQNYLVIENDIVTNVVVLNNITDWQPPENALLLNQTTTPAKIWSLNSTQTAYELTEVLGAGAIGFTWDGIYCLTNHHAPQL